MFLLIAITYAASIFKAYNMTMVFIHWSFTYVRLNSSFTLEELTGLGADIANITIKGRRVSRSQSINDPIIDV